MKEIAYLGMGTMGGGMAANLLKAGYPLTVWNRAAERCAPLVAQGARQADSPAEAAAGADLVMYCLSDDAAVEDLVWGAGGLLEAVQPGQIVVVDVDRPTGRHGIPPALLFCEFEAVGYKLVEFVERPDLRGYFTRFERGAERPEPQDIKACTNS